jgi:3',5'-cyclic AMP phosphodiesterase CpdA
MPDRLLDTTLDPDALLAKLDELQRQRADRPGDARVPAGTYGRIRDALTDPGLRAGTPRAAHPRAPGDETRPPATIYLQPHSALSQFQSVIAYCFEAQAIEAGELAPTEHGLTHWIDELKDRLRRFGPCDIRWIEPALLKLATDLTDDKHPFADLRPATVPLGDRARVVIVGDWATGLPQARNVARSFAAALQAAPHGIDRHVIHLGDTYYSGTEEEYGHLFLPLWPVAAGADAGSWSLNGNHDMYAGGHGYFDVLLGDRRFAGQRRCSYFCLGNDHWRFVGLDDAYTDPDRPSLAGGQIEWLSGLMGDARRPGTILLSHHQPFSAWETVTSALAGEVGQALGGRRVEGWIWGHEHRAAVYEPGIEWREYHDFAQFTAICGPVPRLRGGRAGLARRLVDSLRVVVVAGPRIDPASLPAVDGVELHGYRDDLYRHLAACDLAIAQGGLTTLMELTANGRPFIAFPVGRHFEQNIHVRHRLARYGPAASWTSPAPHPRRSRARSRTRSAGRSATCRSMRAARCARRR